MQLFGTDGDDIIRGDAVSLNDATGRFADDNLLFGGYGNDTLIFGASDYADTQEAFGQAGDDTYVVGSHIGHGVIYRFSEGALDGTDTVRFTDLNLSDLSIDVAFWHETQGNRLQFTWDATATRSAGELWISDEGNYIERFEFADGTTLSDIRFDIHGRVQLIGTDGNEVIRGDALSSNEASNESFEFVDNLNPNSTSDYEEESDLSSLVDIFDFPVTEAVSNLHSMDNIDSMSADDLQYLNTDQDVFLF